MRPEKKPEISVVLCTRNGQEVIEPALQSLLNQTLSKDQYEVLVVDNGSTDHTPQILARYEKEHPGLVRTIHEPAAGLSRARNAGIRAARAGIVVFFDDDARAGQEWLSALLAVFKKDPRIGVAGGPVIPEWKMAKPSWWEEPLESVHSKLDLGPEPRFIRYPEFLFGPNIAATREVFTKAGMFREDLGRRGDLFISGEEAEFQLRAENAGFLVFYEPKAAVRHLARPQRLNMRFIRRQAYLYGRCKRRYEYLAGGKWTKKLWPLPFLLAKGFLGYLTKHRLSKAKQKELIFDFGYLLEGMRLLLEKPEIPPPPKLGE